MSDQSYEGTGDTFATIDLGELGELRFQDDGDNDPYVRSIKLADSDGNEVNANAGLRKARREHGDVAVKEAIETAGRSVASDSESSGTPTTIGPFVCDGCGLTWPGKRDQTPASHENTCPNCHEEDD